MDKFTLQLLQSMYNAYKKENENPLSFNEWLKLVDKGDPRWKPKGLKRDGK